MATLSTPTDDSTTRDSQLPFGAWSEAAPRALRKGYLGEGDKGWNLWRKHLAKRKLARVEALFGGRLQFLTWGLPADQLSDRGRQLIRLLDGPLKGRASEVNEAASAWLSRSLSDGVDDSIECLAWCAALPALSKCLSENLWWQLAARLIQVPTAGPRPTNTLVWQLVQGELPAMLSYSFPEWEVAGSLAELGCRTLQEGLDELLDSHGLPHGKHLADSRPLVACWTRLQFLAAHGCDDPLSEVGERRFAGLVEAVLRLTRADGSQVFLPEDRSRLPQALLKAAVKLADDPTARSILRIRELTAAGRKLPRALPAAACESEWAGLAVLRGDWTRQSPQFSVNYSGPQLVTELSVGKRLLWSGACPVEVRLNGQSLAAEQAWEQICWETDADVDYLELQLVLEQEVTLERHLLLARQDNFLLVADAVVGPAGGRLELRSAWPTAGLSSFQPEAETREGVLNAGGRARARVLPLALNEWRSGPTCGQLREADTALELTQAAEGRALFAPLFFDLEAKRLSKPVTWRQLTVGERRDVVPRDEAVGFRVQAGKSQWLVYRSLTRPATRTVLGKNLATEFLVARFNAPDGKVTPLLEIE